MDATGLVTFRKIDDTIRAFVESDNMTLLDLDALLADLGAGLAASSRR